MRWIALTFLLVFQFLTPISINTNPVILSFYSGSQKVKVNQKVDMNWKVFDFNVFDDLGCRIGTDNAITAPLKCSLGKVTVIYDTPKVVTASLLVEDGRGGQTTQVITINVEK
jgi:hypothetical protein